MSTQAFPRWTTAAEFAADPALDHGYYLLDGEIHEDMDNTHRLHELFKRGFMRR